MSEVNTNINRWRALFWIALAELFALSLWFSASAVLPQLERQWGMSAAEGSWMTTSVQVGFVIGAICFAFLGLADRYNPRKIFAIACIFGAVINSLFTLSTGMVMGLSLRFLTGITMAGVYPTAVKLLSTWFQDRRGFGIGILIAALTLGSSLPHLFNLFIPNVSWKILMLVSSLLALVAAGIMHWGLPDAPESKEEAATVSMNTLKYILKDRPVMLANYGYFGHMWELYAMWTWLPYFLTASFKASLEGTALEEASTLFAFLTIGISGAIGSIIGGLYADKIGKARLSMIAMIVSAVSSICIGLTFGLSIWITVIVAIIWGISVVADSAQFSAMVADFAKSKYVGTALTFQMAIGFLITVFSIYLIPIFEDIVGWKWAFSILAIGPVLGVLAMISLIRYKH
ncbi:MFS transporter [Priestia megaterium]|uniref:MFS transporter n=1 Tax=Priestia megaterium TaxID=1404 RepID=A0AAE5P2Q6_PRIMG|nr:MFS transporter [Priestia megaterium]PES33083.1 MFS transporter [Priestia megaterium]